MGVRNRPVTATRGRFAASRSDAAGRIRDVTRAARAGSARAPVGSGSGSVGIGSARGSGSRLGRVGLRLGGVRTGTQGSRQIRRPTGPAAAGLAHRLFPLEEVIARTAEHRVGLVLGATVDAGDHFPIPRVGYRTGTSESPWQTGSAQAIAPGGQPRGAVTDHAAGHGRLSIRSAPTRLPSTGAAAVLDTDSTRLGCVGSAAGGWSTRRSTTSRREEGGIGDVICGDCGETNKPGMEFCMFCGAYLGWQEQRARGRERRHRGATGPATGPQPGSPRSRRRRERVRRTPPPAPVLAQPERPAPRPETTARTEPARPAPQPSPVTVVAAPAPPPTPAGCPTCGRAIDAGATLLWTLRRAVRLAGHRTLRSPGRPSGARGGPGCGTARTGSPDGRTDAVSRRCTAGAG